MTFKGPDGALPPDYRLGEYRIQTVLGHGGFGITYLALDTKLNAQVAIKEYFPADLAGRDTQQFIAPRDAANAKDYQWGLDKFLEEARALARFKHNHIVRVLRFLETNGTAYMVMDYEEGESLVHYLERQGGRLDEPELLRIFLPILNGLQAVHHAGLLHLDIKPANIYLRRDGRPMLIDFGSARQATLGAADAERTALTPAYAAIEHYPDKGEQGPSTDIYSIGASMYHCVSGRQPVDAMRRYKKILRYEADPLTPATRLEVKGFSPHVLECIDWALEIHASQRPWTVLVFQKGLMGQGRAGRKPKPAAATPSDPKPAPATETGGWRAFLEQADVWKLWRWGLAGAVAIAGLVVAVAYISYDRSAPPATVAQSRAGAPDAAGKTGTEPPPPPASRWVPPDPSEAKKLQEHPAARPRVLAYTLKGHGDTVHAVAFFSGGRRVASASGDGTIRIWDTKSGTIQRILRHQQRDLGMVAASPDGRWLASAAEGDLILVRDTATGRIRGRLQGHDDRIHTLSFSADGRLLASASRDKVVILWDVERRRILHRLPRQRRPVHALAFGPDGSWLATAGADGYVRYWGTATGRKVGGFQAFRDQIRALAISPDGRWLALGGPRLLRIWDVQKARVRRNLSRAPGFVYALRYSPDGKWLYAAGSDNTLAVWDSQSGGLEREFKGHSDSVRAIALSADGRLLASGGFDRTVRVWKP